MFSDFILNVLFCVDNLTVLLQWRTQDFSDGGANLLFGRLLRKTT